MAEREPAEVGVDVTTLCPSCGGELKPVANPDGSISGETHEKCYKGPSKSDIKDIEKAATAMTVPAETGVTGGNGG